MPKRQRQRRGSGSGSSSSGSSNSSRKRRQAKTMMPPTGAKTPPSDSSSAAASPSAESDPFKSDSTDTTSSSPAPSSPASTASPKPSKFDKVKAALRRKLPSGRNRKKKASISSNSSGGISDTSVEGDSPINTTKGRVSAIPEVTITPSTDSSTSASPAASIRTVFRIDPRTGKPAQQYDLHCLSPRSAANARQRQPRRTRNSSRASSPQFSRRTSSLRHSHEFPFDPNTAVQQPDDSHLYQSNPSSPTACSQLSERPLSLEAPSVTSNSSLDKPLPALPQEQRTSVIDFHAAGAATPIQVSPKSIEADDDDTPRAPAWPLPVERQSVYGPTFPIFDAPPVPPKDNSPTNVDDDGATPRTRSGSGSSQPSMYGFHYYNPLDDRALAARLQQIRANHPSNVTPDDFPSVPTSTAAPGAPLAFANQFENAFQSLSSQAPAQSDSSTRASFASALSTTASFMTALEDVGGDADDEASAAEGEPAAENKGLRTALLSPTENNDDAVPAETNINNASEPLDDSGIDMSKYKAENDIKPATVQQPEMDSDDGVSEAAGSDGGDESEDEDEYAGIDNSIPPINGHFPAQPGAGPNVDLIEDQQGKIKWVPGHSAMPDPEWVMEPQVATIKSVVRVYAHLLDLDKDDIEVEYFAEGTFNKLYTVRKASQAPGSGPEYIFRVCLPAYPWYKLESEIATMELVRKCTDIPVPKVYAFDSDGDNPIGHEWMMMDKVKGVCFKDARESMSMEQKTHLADTLADWMHQLATLRFDKIGSVYRHRKQPASGKEDFKVGPIIDQTYMADWRLEYKVHRGPFASTEQFFRSLVDVNLYDVIDPRQKKRSEFAAITHELALLERTLDDCKTSFERKQVEKAQEKWAGRPADKQALIAQHHEQIDELRQDQDEHTDTVFWDRARYPIHSAHGAPLNPFEKIPKMCQGLQFVIANLCPSERLGPNSTVLHHWDISDNNILINDAGEPVALVDWEQVQTLPFSLIDPYPRAIFDAYDVGKPPAPLNGGEEEDVVDMHKTNTEFHENFLLRAAFKKRLEELHSPHLEAFAKPEVDLKHLMGLAREADQMRNRLEIESLVEKAESQLGRGF
ncbi:hypothetical protein SLS56_004999 [Neofusicoccum ribis]|uniref:Aminoglycoside phosphotransferase domain-containing protein n=1 Tax=Neofusicoccum ribis TaxID=45134 RepID=A0ABR3SUS8_9PEZI